MENKIRKAEEIWDGTQGSEDLWEFIEEYVSTWNLDEIAWIDDIYKVLDEDYEDDFVERNPDLFSMTEDELTEEMNRLTTIVFEDAYANYLESFKK